MIYRVRTMRLTAEKEAAVRDVAIRAAAYVTANYDDVDVEVLENIAGHRREIHMVTRCPSLAALEAYEAARRQDEAWTALVTEVNALEGTATVVDRLYRRIS